MANKQKYNSERDYFLKNVKTDETTGCWLWTGFIRPNGYGRFRYRKIEEPAHRAAVRILRGITLRRGYKDGIVAHVCNNKHCVNPAHLLVNINQAAKVRQVQHWEAFAEDYPIEVKKMEELSREVQTLYLEWLRKKGLT